MTDNDILDLAVGRVYSGRVFNERCTLPLYKLTNALERHYGMQYVDGLNVDTVPFSPSGTCMKGGMYFCTERNMHEFFRSLKEIVVYRRRVTIPDDALVYVESRTFKTDKFILGPREALHVLMRDCGLMSIAPLKYYASYVNPHVDNDDPALSDVALYDVMHVYANDDVTSRFNFDMMRVPPTHRTATGAIARMATGNEKNYFALRWFPTDVFLDLAVIAALDTYNVPMRNVPMRAHTFEMWVAAFNNPSRDAVDDINYVPAKILNAWNVGEALDIVKLRSNNLASWEAKNKMQAFYDAAFEGHLSCIEYIPKKNRTQNMNEVCVNAGRKDLLKFFDSQTEKHQYSLRAKKTIAKK